jgi:hypothetical protein
MAIYEQALSLINTLTKYNSDGYSIRAIYHTCMASFLQYCCGWKVYRFDYFDDFGRYFS